MIATQTPERTKRIKWAWYMYDFGSSAYASVILLAVYSVYFKDVVVGGKEGTGLWGLSLSIAMIIVALLSPFLGALADFSGRKVAFLFWATNLTLVFTALLFFIQAGDVFFGVLFFILAEIGFRGGEVFYNALLPDIASREETAMVSGNGMAIGSVGGVVCLGIVLLMIQGIGGPLVVRSTFVFTSLFFAASAAPLFIMLRRGGTAQTLPAGETLLGYAVKKVSETIRTLMQSDGEHRDFRRYLLAYVIYNEGIISITNFGTILGAVLFGMEPEHLVAFVLLVNVTHVVGAFISGLLGRTLGFKRGLIVSLLIVISTGLSIFIIPSLTWYFVLGGIIGFGNGAVQSLSRGYIAEFAPRGQSAEFYGLFSFAGRTSSFISPAIYGFLAYQVAAWAESNGMAIMQAEVIGQKAGAFSIVLFIITGLLLVLRLKDDHPRQAGHELDPATP